MIHSTTGYIHKQEEFAGYSVHTVLYLGDVEYESCCRIEHHLGDVDCRDDNAALARAAMTEMRARRYSMGRARCSPSTCGIGGAGSSAR